MDYKLKKFEKETNILYNQTTDPVEICGYDRQLFRKLEKFAEECPELCQRTDKGKDPEYYKFVVDKKCLSVRFNRPMSEEKKEAARARAQANGLGGKTSS